MKVVIDIPEALYDRVKQLDYNTNMYDFADSMYHADIKNLAIAIKDGSIIEDVINGVPLPIEEIIEELESRKSYGVEYAQAMEDVIVILKAKFSIDKDGENE